MLVTLGLGDIASSPGFVATLAALFVNLAAVLAARAGATVRRVRWAPPAPAAARAIVDAEPGLALGAGPLDAARVLSVLARNGFRAVAVGGDVVWGVKHRLAPLGFPLFHASFFLMLAGGLQLYLAPGAAVRLDALGSSDVNGDALTFEWYQTLGSAVTGPKTGSQIYVTPRRTGYYGLEVAATGAGKSATAEVRVLVTNGPVPTAIGASYPVDPKVGTQVFLDATASLVEHDGVTFAWTKVEGPDATILGADRPVALFVPKAPGRYVFEVTVGDEQLRSPPERVDVYVAGSGGIPEVSITAPPGVVAVNAPVSLEATGTTIGGYAWKQVSGPAAGLTDADQATATVVPFQPGFYVFEVAVSDGEATSRPVRVAFEARVGGASGASIPVARVEVPGLAPVVGQLVFLDGRKSTGAGRFRWTQVSGPWVVLGGQTEVTSFRAHSPGLYVFELEVDDGKVRSAPARVEINVSEEAVQ